MQILYCIRIRIKNIRMYVLSLISATQPMIVQKLIKITYLRIITDIEIKKDNSQYWKQN